MSQLTAILNGCGDALDESDDGEVPWVWRVRLAHAMDQEFPFDSHYRQSVLAYVVANRTLLAWASIEERVPNRFRLLPNRLIQNCRLLIMNEITAEQAEDYDIALIEDAMSLWEEFGNAAWSPLACYAAIRCASSRQHEFYKKAFYPLIWNADGEGECSEDKEEWESWDTHFWGCCVAGGHPGLEGFDGTKRRNFYQGWLDHDVMSIVGETSIVESLLNSN